MGHTSWCSPFDDPTLKRSAGRQRSMARVTPLEIILRFTAHYVSEGDRAEALETAKKAEPYMGLSAKQIVDALVAGRTVPQLQAENDTESRQGHLRPMPRNDDA
jgi:hypothetical protein